MQAETQEVYLGSLLVPLSEEVSLAWEGRTERVKEAVREESKEPTNFTRDISGETIVTLEGVSLEGVST
jgi:hypothetical protein